MKFVTLLGGPLDGESRAVPERNRLAHAEATGPVHVYRPTEDPAIWEYDLEASTIETLQRAGVRGLDDGRKSA